MGVPDMEQVISSSISPAGRVGFDLQVVGVPPLSVAFPCVVSAVSLTREERLPYDTEMGGFTIFKEITSEAEPASLDAVMV